MIVAVLDTGIDYNHEDLRDNMWRERDTSGHDVFGENLTSEGPPHDPMDGNGHGTHVAGTIGAVGDNSLGVVGVCWHVRLMAVKVLNDRGAGADDTITRGIDYAVHHGARIICGAFGSGLKVIEPVSMLPATGAPHG